MDHAMADAVQAITAGVADHRQQLLQCSVVVGAGYRQLFTNLTAAPPVQGCLGTVQALGQAAEQWLGVRLVDQGELEGRAPAVDDQNITSAHQDSFSASCFCWRHQPQSKGWPSCWRRCSASSTQARDCQGGW